MTDQIRTINWFPGHMAKARRILMDQMKHIDLVIEICDARLPYSSRNPELARIISGKRRILFLNKSDLADPDCTKEWIRYFRSQGEDAYMMSAATLKSKETTGIIDKVTHDMVERALKKGIRKTIHAMVIGVPNVGKSTLINRLRGSAVTRTGDRPGITRGSQWVRVTPYLELLDTPGMLWPRLDDQNAAIRLCWIGSVKDEINDLSFLAVSLMEELKHQMPEIMKERFHLTDLNLENEELLDAVCRGRGWLLKGNRYDYDRCCSVVLDEFRSGKIGKITLELPDSRRDVQK